MPRHHRPAAAARTCRLFISLFFRCRSRCRYRPAEATTRYKGDGGRTGPNCPRAWGRPVGYAAPPPHAAHNRRLHHRTGHDNPAHRFAPHHSTRRPGDYLPWDALTPTRGLLRLHRPTSAGQRGHLPGSRRQATAEPWRRPGLPSSFRSRRPHRSCLSVIARPPRRRARRRRRRVLGPSDSVRS